MKNLIAGNWKMNGTLDLSLELARDIVHGIQDNPQLLEKNDFLICPPYPYLVPVQTELSHAVALGAQDCAAHDNGAHTGDVSADMLKDINCSYVILGHSERRHDHDEHDGYIAEKASFAHRAGLVTIICVGETEEQREQGIQEDVVGEQLRDSLPCCVTAQNTVIAYEPVWAIGTGKTATPDDIKAMHAFIREQLEDKNIRILYGGSMKPGNAAEILAIDNVNGGLIGGASLKAEDFLGIAKAA